MHGSTSCSTVCARRDCSGCRNRTEREWKHSLQSVKKQHFDSCASCGSTHKIEFAKQIHKFREHGPDHPLLPLCGNSPCVSRNLYKGRKNVPVRARFFFSIRSKAWFRARGCSKNDSFSTASRSKPRFRSNSEEKPRLAGTFFLPLYKFRDTQGELPHSGKRGWSGPCSRNL